MRTVADAGREMEEESMRKRTVLPNVVLVASALLCLTQFLYQASGQKAPRFSSGSKLVSKTDPAYNDAAFLNTHEFPQGCPPDYFDGQHLLTRYEFAMHVERILKDVKIRLLEIPKSFPGSYDDYPPVGGMTQEELDALKRLYTKFESEVSGFDNDSKACKQFLAKLQDIATQTSKISLKDLPEFTFFNRYRVDPYLQAAITLQAMGKEKACQTLLTLSRSGDYFKGQSLYLLCRMLFTARGANKFRGPFIGRSYNLTPAEWPLEPIEIVDGVPFVITVGYDIGGAPEQPSQYIRYCMQNCEWSKTRFQMKTAEEKQRALKKFLSSAKCKGIGESGFLFDQIKEMKK